MISRNVTIALLATASVVLLAGCGSDSDAERLARLGLPAADYRADINRGAEGYATNCRECHGPGARGTDKGPPLIHGYYVPSHHADFAFYSAVKKGVVQHHWEFGDMPPQPQVSPELAADITAYVRGLQQRVGIR